MSMREGGAVGRTFPDSPYGAALTISCTVQMFSTAGID